MAGRARIYQAWHDIIHYELDGRKLEFDCPSLIDPPQVVLPGAGAWRDRVPGWAAPLRDQIVADFWRSGATVFEASGMVQTVVRPGESFRIEFIANQQERWWREVRIVRLPDHRVVLSIAPAMDGGGVRFPAAGIVSMSLRNAAQVIHDITVDVARERFSAEDGTRDRPLADLPQWFRAAPGRVDFRPGTGQQNAPVERPRSWLARLWQQVW
ncbi:MAG: hypothetical protein U1E70_19875 [Acetobacteraceae bacterium]|nr:hypothetical protein [Pseudomonadota bacterium]